MFHLMLAIIYLSFISLGLPDALLGSAWPTMYPVFGVPLSYAGIISTIISAGTVVSSLQSDRLTRALGAGKVTALSVATTALALFGFSISNRFWALCLWAIPYGLGAGSVDAALNNYVALHYTSRHMSWLHCMWGLGASTGPYIMGYILTNDLPWTLGYRAIGCLQVVLTAVLLLSLPLWKARPDSAEASSTSSAPLTLPRILSIPGAKQALLTCFGYCALEQTAMLWSGSYLVLVHGIPAEAAASLSSLAVMGITIGRGASGFLTMKLNDAQMVYLGQGVIAAGIVVLLLPFPSAPLLGLLLVGLGCAPIYPCVLHATPEHFGAGTSQAIMGVQMASAYVGTCLMPLLFGLVANHISAALLPVYLLAILVLMVIAHRSLVLRTAK